MISRDLAHADWFPHAKQEHLRSSSLRSASCVWPSSPAQWCSADVVEMRTELVACAAQMGLTERVSHGQEGVDSSEAVWSSFPLLFVTQNRIVGTLLDSWRYMVQVNPPAR